MHDVLRQRLIRRIESLPDAQIYQVLDYIEFLESKYADAGPVEASGLQRFAEGLEDKLRKKAVSPSTIREAFQLISAADRVLAGVSSAGRQILGELNQTTDPLAEGGEGGRAKPARRGSVPAEGRPASGGTPTSGGGPPTSGTPPAGGTSSSGDTP